MLGAHPEVGLVAGATMVGAAASADPINARLAASPLSQGSLPGPRVLNFPGHAAVVRRDAFLAAGGYSRMLFIGGEEKLLAYDLAGLGWPATYRPDVTAHHWPPAIRDARRRTQELRNHVLIGWLRRPLARALADTGRLAAIAHRDRDPVAARALAEALAILPRALLWRRPLPALVEADIQFTERTRIY